jgi:DNA-binding LytR/AlgR family response regulator
MEKEQEVLKWEQKKIVFFSKKIKMRIAVCDKDKNILQNVKYKLYDYAETRRLDMVVDCYVSGEAIFNSKNRYNIIFLSYDLAGENGLNIAKRIRCHDNHTVIIFMSDDAEVALKSFEVRPYRFMIPPINTQDLYNVMDDFFREYATICPIWVKCGEDTVCLNTGDIVYLEADNKHCIIHLEDEELRCNKTMAKVSSVLPPYCFCKINRAYIVNCNHIKRYNNESVSLTGKHSLHISRKYNTSFKTQYREFLNPREP